jgi:hypothetical protein
VASRQQLAAIAPQFGVSLEKPATVVYGLARLGLFVLAGASPVLAISAHTFGLIDIHTAAVFVVVPSAIIAAMLCLARVPESSVVVYGFLGGLLGVLAYDGARIPFVIAGIWPDFIPQLGAWILGDADGTNLVVGYTWRWLGDGGGMAIVFAMGCALLNWRKHMVITGVCYGIFIWSGLMGTILLAERGPELLFPITPINFAASLAGHLIYGSVLGWTFGRLRARAESSRSRSQVAASPWAAAPDERRRAS